MNVTVRAHLWDTSGIARVGRYLCEELRKLVNLSIELIEKGDSSLFPSFEELEKLTGKQLSSDIKITISTLASGASREILYTVYEGTRVPRNLLGECEKCIETWVPSSFTRDSFLRSGLSHNCRVIPYGVDSRVFYPSEKAKSDKFRFLSVFNWSWRKGYDVLLRAYEKVRNEETELVIKSVLQAPSDLKSYSLEGVKLLSTRMRDSELNSLYNSADCLVLPSRGEAFSLTLLEAGAVGLPVITTRWGGQLDYLNDSNSFLIDVKELVSWPGWELVDEEYKEILYANPDVDHLAYLMSYVLENRDEAEAKGLELRKTALRMSWKHTALKVYEALQELIA